MHKAKMGAAKCNSQIRKVFDISAETLYNLLRNQRALALSDGYTGNLITELSSYTGYPYSRRR
jgi:phosphoribosyl-dephospho-CoA transferase